MSELKSCPCCGEEIQGGVRLTGYMMMNRKYIKCDACGLKMESSYDIDGLSQTHLKAITEDLIRRWNTRKPMQNIVERLERFNEESFYRANGRANGKTLAYGYSQGIYKAIETVKEEGDLNE